MNFFPSQIIVSWGPKKSSRPSERQETVQYGSSRNLELELTIAVQGVIGSDTANSGVLMPLSPFIVCERYH